MFFQIENAQHKNPVQVNQDRYLDIYSPGA